MSEIEFKTIEVIEKHLPENTIVPAIKGRIMWIGERKDGVYSSGDSKGQPYSNQSFMLVDTTKSDKDEFCKIFVNIKNREELDRSLIKRDVVVWSYKGPRGLNGVKVGPIWKDRRQLVVTRTGRISTEDEFARDNPTEGSVSSDMEEPQQATEAATDSPPPEEGKEATEPLKTDEPPSQEIIDDEKLGNINRIKRQLGKTMAIHNLCFDAAATMAKELKGRHDYIFTPTIIQQWARDYFHTIFRAGDGVGMINNPEFPINLYEYAPFKGHTLMETIPELVESLDKTRAHNIEQEEKAKEAAKETIQREKDEAIKKAADEAQRLADEDREREKEQNERPEETSDGSAYELKDNENIEDDVPF